MKAVLLVLFEACVLLSCAGFLRQRDFFMFGVMATLGAVSVPLWFVGAR